MPNNLREVSTHALRKTVLFHTAVRDLPAIRAGLLAVLNLITRHDEFNLQHIHRDFIFTIAEAVPYDPQSWKPWIHALADELIVMKSQQAFTTRLDYLEAWQTILDTIDNVLDVSYNQPVASLN